MYSEKRLSYNRKEAGGWQARLKIRGIHYIYIIYLAEPFIQSIPFKVYFLLVCVGLLPGNQTHDVGVANVL